MYFRLGGSTIKGISKAGEIVWSRIYVDGGKNGGELCMDLGRGKAIDLLGRDAASLEQHHAAVADHARGDLRRLARQMNGKHQANHIQVVYANDAKSRRFGDAHKAAMAAELGLSVQFVRLR